MRGSAEKGGPSRVAVVGGGAWGTTLAIVASRAGSSVTLLVRDDARARLMQEDRKHPRSLTGIRIPDPIRITSNPEEAIMPACIVVLAIPTQRLREGVAHIASLLRDKIVVSAAKGIEIGSLARPSTIVAEVLEAKGASICALSGPNLAMEIAQEKPGTTVVASHDSVAAEMVQNALMGPSFRVYTSTDVVGVEMGGALKNIIAIGAGIGDGLQAGDNAKAAFMTRGIVEISRLGMAHGAEIMTFAGLSGVGDLIATCSSGLSRNHRVGVGLASGLSLAQVLEGMSEVAEGVDTTRAARALAQQSGTDMPITEQMYQVLFEGKSPVSAVRDLMLREPRVEHGGPAESS